LDVNVSELPLYIFDSPTKCRHQVDDDCVYSESVEYCQFESFNASCAPDQVIVIEEAHYGRLRIGRCVTRDYGYLGCAADVTDILDRSCSGQRWCHFSVPTLRDLVHPCPKDLTAYLEASYRCETGSVVKHCLSALLFTSFLRMKSNFFTSHFDCI